VWPAIAIAGKSGTAQIPTEEGYTEDDTIVTFAGYAPADDPQVCHSGEAGSARPEYQPWANYTAAPVFAQVARRVFDHLQHPARRCPPGQDRGSDRVSGFCSRG
jgi:cell division protein FtsI/penicillin-binding protein 2